MLRFPSLHSLHFANMSFGILEDKYLKDVPGTALLTDLQVAHGHQRSGNVTNELKHGTGRHAHIVLVPQPSDDPNDPLNWPRWRKEACFWTLAFAASLDGALSPMVGPGYVLLSKQFGVSVDDVASSFGTILLGLACFMLIQNTLATKYGHRIVYFGSVSLTMFKREAVASRSGIDHKEASIDKTTVVEDEDVSVSALEPQRHSYRSQLKLWNGTFSEESPFKIFLKPFPFLLSPITFFIFLVHGMQTVWLSLMPICSSTIFTLEYGFNASQIGLTNLGGIVGIVLAMLVSGPLTDWGTVWLSKRNKGIYEPEFRIIFITTMLFGVFGYAGWAVGTSHNMPWIGAVACITMANFSMVVSGAAAVTYLLDSHGPAALHILALSNFMKNIVLYGFTFFANGMVLNRGVKTSLLILAGCQAFCWLASIPMYIFGKRVRSFVARHPGTFSL
ncbi:hypothetical protein ONZ45_g448 [Pleurotus djamor]|nr:hypothetical protein ONZ45_g448 [Pleurotus djamor]